MKKGESKTPREYEILKFLGKGAYGVTFLVKDKEDRKCVMKKISLSKSNIADVLLEVQALKKVSKYNKCDVNKSNISALCLVDDFMDYEKNEYVIVTNYLENSMTLTTLLNKNKELNKTMELKDVIFVMSKLLSQLDNLHKHGIVHNDIKPDNIIIQYDDNNINNVLFIDFGVSCIKKCRPSGTVVYLAPELFRIIGASPEDVIKLKNKLMENISTIDEGKTIPINKNDYMKTDVFSLGLVFYEMLHNKLPYPYREDYIRSHLYHYKESPLEFELDMLELKDKNKELYDYINNVSISTIEENNNTDDKSEEEEEEKLLDYKINIYLNETVPQLLSPESVLSYYTYYKTSPHFVGSYFENETGNPDIARTINSIIEKMLIVDPLHRPSVHRLKQQFNKVLNI